MEVCAMAHTSITTQPQNHLVPNWLQLSNIQYTWNTVHKSHQTSSVDNCLYQLTDDIEVRIHGNFSAENEDTPVQLLEIYVQ